MNKPVFVFDLNRVLPEEQVEELRVKLAAQIESGILLLGDEVTFVEAFSADEAAPVVAFEPRHMVEEVDGEKHEYADTLWLPYAIDVFGVGDWWKDEPDSVQLEIFKEERDRVKSRPD